MGKKALYQCLTLAFLLGGWETLARTGAWDPLFFPAPSEVATFLAHGILDGSLLTAVAVTVRRLLLGFGMGLVLGVPLGLAVAYSPFAAATLGVVALGMQALPSVCWIPLALLWFGQNEGAVLFVVMMGTVWSIILGVSGGIRTVPPIYERAARTMGARGFHLLWKVLLPASLPVLLGGVKQGWAFAWRSLLAAEIFVTILSGLGLGQLLHYGRQLHAMEQVVGVMVIIVGIGVVTDGILLGGAQRALHRRWGLGAFGHS